MGETLETASSIFALVVSRRHPVAELLMNGPFVLRPLILNCLIP